MKAIILAGGKGTRFKNVTKRIPKSLVRVSGKPIIEYTLSSLPSSIKEIYIIIGHLGEKIKKHIGAEYKGLKVKYIEIKNLTGTATTLSATKKYLDKEKFLVLYGDDIYSKNELGQLIKHGWAFGLSKILPPSPKYLAIQLDNNHNITGARYPTEKEMKKGVFVSTGAFVLDRNIFKYKPVKISNGEYGLPQTILKAAKKYPIKGILMKKWFQINTPEDVIRAEQKLK